MAGVPAFRGQELVLELVDPGPVQLVRLFSHPNGEWEPPPIHARKLRVDPPPGHESEFAVLYTASTLACVAAECHVLTVDLKGQYTANRPYAADRDIVRYDFAAPALFIPIDRGNEEHLGLTGDAIRFDPDNYLPYREVALELFRRYGNLAHGLSWNSFHRNQLGRVYAIWHHRKADMRLTRPLAPIVKLADDPEWQAFLKKWPINVIGP